MAAGQLTADLRNGVEDVSFPAAGPDWERPVGFSESTTATFPLRTHDLGIASVRFASQSRPLADTSR